MPKTLKTHRVATVAVAAISLVVGLVVAVPAALAHTTSGHATTARTVSSQPKAKYTPPAIKHVWIITLENESFGYTFGKPGEKQAPYLTKTLPAKGALLDDYYGVGHDSLDNYTAMISGQAPNYELGQDCGLYEPFIQFGGENFDKWTKYGQLSGEGCVYPKYVSTVANQLTNHKLTWKAYEQDMGNIPHRDKTVSTSNGPACGHPKLGAVDLTDSTGPKTDSYATRHDPFVYFKSITGKPAYCDSHVLSLHAAEDRPEEDLDDAELLVHHAEHLRRRPRHPAVPERHEGRPAEGQHVPEELDPADHGLAGLQGERHDRDQLRRVRH